MKQYQHSLQIINKAFYGKRINKNAMPVQDTKLITYVIDRFNYDPDEREILRMIDHYFNLHRRELLNIGGEWALKSFRESVFICNKLEVTEIWEKSDQNINREIVEIQLFSYDIPFDNKLSYHDIKALNISDTNHVSLIDLLGKEKDYIELTSINNIAIVKSDIPYYLEALKQENWSKIEEYVRNE